MEEKVRYIHTHNYQYPERLDHLDHFPLDLFFSILEFNQNQRFKSLRLTLGISQIQMCKMIKCSQSRLCKLETNQQDARTEHIYYLSKHLNISMIDLCRLLGLYTDIELKPVKADHPWKNTYLDMFTSGKLDVFSMHPLKVLRLKKGYTQQQIADITRSSQGRYVQIELGRVPSLHELFAYSQVFKKSPENLLKKMLKYRSENEYPYK
jgi:transcriptional regulator with XRE-family HTH domain